MEIVPPDPPNKTPTLADTPAQTTPITYMGALYKTVPSDKRKEESLHMPASHGAEMDTLPEENQVILAGSDKARIYIPWSYSVIVKLTTKKIDHEYLKKILA